MEYEPVIGLEVHAQLLTRSKIFCSSSTAFGDPANQHTSPVTLGLPGALPVLNGGAVEMAVRAALALGCRINGRSIFARKHYFYPDLPKGYQISQYEEPLARHGQVEVWTGPRDESGKVSEQGLKTFRILRVHMEEDAGKSVHSPDGGSYVNLNRAGVPLIEIVSQPDFRSSQEAYDYMTQLRLTLMYLGICDGNMEEGSLRCDANVSVRPKGQEKLGTKLEIKNLNSFRFLQKALDYEIERQIAVVSQGGKVHQETRLWDEDKGRTFVMRSKEEAQDYRYFPDPDIPPLVLEAEWVDRLRGQIPELPETRRRRLVEAFGLEGEEARQIIQSRTFADFFEEAVQAGAEARSVFNWMVGALTRALKDSGKDLGELPVTGRRLAKLIQLENEGVISGKIAKKVFDRMLAQGGDPESIVEKEGLRQISDAAALQDVVEKVVRANPDKVDAYRAGKTGLLGFFVGQVMRETRGQANPQLVNEILKEKLESR
ncbi:MAG TPA: Asp-tRNA(Asn)/Glu-tRNA(Gln) amidotransferase subunit GatB [Acidobacteriota bacterium]|nr:Asp-tRNA(Asn)/Glu-tRNA(Gln) amidotransferase subunit GatB [Acidobacteriota bacterium]